MNEEFVFFKSMSQHDSRYLEENIPNMYKSEVTGEEFYIETQPPFKPQHKDIYMIEWTKNDKIIISINKDGGLSSKKISSLEEFDYLVDWIKDLAKATEKERKQKSLNVLRKQYLHENEVRMKEIDIQLKFTRLTTHPDIQQDLINKTQKDKPYIVVPFFEYNKRILYAYYLYYLTKEEIKTFDEFIEQYI